MRVMFFPAIVLVIVSILVMVTTGIAIGLGHVLHWLAPALDYSACVLTVMGAIIL